MKFIKLTTFSEEHEIFVNVEAIESIGTRCNVLGKPMGGTIVLMSSGKEHLVKESAEWIIHEMHFERPDWYDLGMDNTLETIYKNKESIEREQN